VDRLDSSFITTIIIIFSLVSNQHIEMYKNNQSWNGRTAKDVGQTLNTIPMVTDIHDWDAGHLADATLKVAITRCDNVDLVLVHALDQAVVRIGASVRARQALKPRILGNPAKSK